jgi:small subunit ribosomal protein S18
MNHAVTKAARKATHFGIGNRTGQTSSMPERRRRVNITVEGVHYSRPRGIPISYIRLHAILEVTGGVETHLNTHTAAAMTRGPAQPWPKAAALRKPKKKVNPLDKEGIAYIDYKDTALLRKFISDRGKIRARRVTGVTAQQQRQIARAVKNAREMALLPYTATTR